MDSKLDNKIMRIFFLVIFLHCFVCLGCIESSLVRDRDDIITIHCDRKTGQVNGNIYGNNIIAYDPMTYEDWTKEYYGFSDYGAGIWDPERKRSVKEVVKFAKDIGISILRFPGGCGAHHYDWKNTIGKHREHFLYGIDEFLETCEKIGAEAVITVSYFTGTEQDAADLVEYLNSPNDETNPNGGIDWAKERAGNGHPLPYNIKYFEIGNEIWHGDHRKIKEVLPEEYGKRYLKYYEAMKAVDPNIKIGFILYRDSWDKKALEIIEDKLDFGIIHIYLAPAWGRKLEGMSAKEIFRISLGMPVFRDEAYLQNTLKLLKQISKKDIPLAITEYNGGFVQDKPIPYRHCLGTALLNAELLRIFMKPEHKILMANYWQFCNSYWGMIRSQEDFMTHDYRYPINYIKRPNYYVFELYNKHFGSDLIAADVICRDYKVEGFSIPYLSVSASSDEDKNKIYLMVINKNLSESITASIDLRNFDHSNRGEAWILNGPNINATNEKNPNNVKVVHKNFEIDTNPFRFNFEPHSLTAIEIVKRNE